MRSVETIYQSEGRDRDKTFDHAKWTAQKMHKRVVVLDGNNRPIMEFAATSGIFNEVPPLPLKRSMAAVLVEGLIRASIINPANGRDKLNSKRAQTSYRQGLGILQGYEQRGGGL